MDRGNEGQFAGSFTGCGPPPQQRQQRSQQQQHRPPQHLQQQRFSGHQAGSTPSSRRGRGSWGAYSTAFHQRHVGGRAVFLETPSYRGRAQRPGFCLPLSSPLYFHLKSRSVLRWRHVHDRCHLKISLRETVLKNLLQLRNTIITLQDGLRQISSHENRMGTHSVTTHCRFSCVLISASIPASAVPTSRMKERHLRYCRSSHVCPSSLNPTHFTSTLNPDPFSAGAIPTIAAISNSPCVKTLLA